MKLYSESKPHERHVKINKAVKICSEDCERLGLARMLHMDADEIMIVRLGLVWDIPVLSALGSLKQDYHEYKASLGYIVHSRAVCL